MNKLPLFEANVNMADLDKLTISTLSDAKRKLENNMAAMSMTQTLAGNLSSPTSTKIEMAVEKELGTAVMLSNFNMGVDRYPTVPEIVVHLGFDVEEPISINGSKDFTYSLGRNTAVSMKIYKSGSHSVDVVYRIPFS